MPFKQKARNNKDDSSSSVPTKKDLASRYKAPFPIYTIEEGEHFTRLTKSNFTGFPTKGFASKPKGWNAASVWEMLTGQSSFNARNASNKWFKDESLLYLHKYLCYALYGRWKPPRSKQRVPLGIGNMAPILIYATRMPIPPYRAQPTNIFRYMDGAFLKKSGLVDEVKDGNIMVYRWKSWERRVGQGNRNEGTSRMNEEQVRQKKGKSPMTSSAPAEEEAEEVAGWKQVLSRIDTYNSPKRICK
ncbi:hypothetical protein JCGZ_19342 [Jatropha curcas]|uniref:Uncharacterized protein n=1 Tax=Jatropha curcas TaxID=180498 RepID=A0A067K364_JATCU|nr:hypothetical protein JCGZ_19342 [Jatropha curcas]